MGLFPSGVASLPKGTKLDNDAIMLIIENDRTAIHARGRALCIAVLALPILACWPVAKAIAGKQTEFNMTVSITVAITMSIATGATYLWGSKHKKRANEGEAQVRKLTKGRLSPAIANAK